MMDDYLKTSTILYVEDEEEVQEGYSKALQRYSKELYLASNGQEGFEFFKKYSPDIIVTDINMPIMNGLDMIRAIKEINDEQIVIITSAYSDEQYFIDAITLSVDGYILKPVDKSILKEKINYFSKQISLQKELKEKRIIVSQKDKLASMGEMIGNIAHHWRQPLSVISTVASGMELEKDAGVLSDEKFNNYIKIILNNTNMLSDTIEEFKNFIINDKNIINFNISDTIQNSLNLITQAIDNKNIQLIKNIDKELSLTNCKNNFIQSIFNILNNAIEAFNNQINKYIFISLVKYNNKIVLEIKDNAGGIDEEILPKIFEAYTTTKHQYIGTGLGLYTTYNILTNEMNCDISVSNDEFTHDNKIYKGAVFKITLNEYE